MASPSKEENVLRLLLENSPLREWHFEEVVREASVTRAVANKWLKKYVQEGLLQRVKRKGEFPFFTVGEQNAVYYSLKRVFALQELHESGLFPALFSSTEAKTIILFGSMAKGDWYKDSDIDIFVLGNLSDFNKKTYEELLQRHIELHLFERKSALRKIRTGLLKNVMDGYVIKGSIQDIFD